MGEQIPVAEIISTIAPRLVSSSTWGDASFISLPLVYPSGSFVTVRISYVLGGIRVSDSGFAFRETESFGASRSFPNTARAVAETFDVAVGRRSIYADVPLDDVERAIFDVSAASYTVATRIVANVAQDNEVELSDALHARLDRIFPNAVDYDGKIVGASSTEWEVTAVARADGRKAVFQAVSNYPISVYKASTAFHDIAALDNPPSLISVIQSKAEMGKNYGILAQAGRVIEIGQNDDVFIRAAA